MALTPKSLADGQISTGTLTPAAVYTVPADTAAMLTIVISNASEVNQIWAEVLITRSGSTPRRIIPVKMVMDPGDTAFIDHEGRPFVLSEGDSVDIGALGTDGVTAAELDYYIDGIEKPL